MNDRQTLQTHTFSCSHCNASFESRDRNQLASTRKGRNVYCNDRCRTAMEIIIERNRPGRHICGPCPTCGNEFRSRIKNKSFCSIKCYCESDQFKAMLASNRAALNPREGIPRVCPACSIEFPRSKRSQFCSDFCRRSFFASRFDRFIANPEAIALPQNFDEFLDRDELPCLIDGCDWVGVGLSYHVNFHHGIKPDKFREMVGFNSSTALMGVSARKQRSKIMLDLLEKGTIKPCSFPLQECSKERNPLRLEGREHWEKAMAISGGRDKFIAAGVARNKSQTGRNLSSEIAKKTNAEMPKIVLVCHECGTEYKATKSRAPRSKFCGLRCRNNSNNRKRRIVSESVNKEFAK